MIPTRDELMLLMDEAEWSCLRAHLKRGGLLLIDNSLDLIDVAIKIAGDDTIAIKDWINSGVIGKPSEKQIFCWDETMQKRFSMLIVSPYVLIQDQILIKY